ncbi:MAG: ABC-F family ATP-binding cassette domain-containing protein [Geminicoccaceae bacterium]|nr:ABC-F family ATP-binding cassette domain-containing protein [Geminicoccaceae bacterium]
MLHINDLTLRIAGRVLLEGASLHVAMGQKVGFVGRNGTGKTSLLRLIEGRLQPDQGEVRLRSAARLGAVAQDAPGGDSTPLSAVLAADRERQSLLDELERSPGPERIAEIETRLLEIRADAAPARAARILKGLGFDDDGQLRPLSSFSGGWRMRVALASVLFVEPDLLLLDEPTNHLDLEATMWLEQHLKAYPRTLFMVSHDRELLNSVPDRIVHLEGGQLKAYAGGYDNFERTRREKMVLEEKAREKQELQRRHIQAFVDRFRYKASKARQAQSRIKMLERMQPVGDVVSEPEIHFDFGGAAIPAPPMISIERAEAGYGGKPVLRRLDLRLDPEDRIALLGANGNGKSTLARLLAGTLEPMGGTITRARNLEVGFFAQHQIESLQAERTPIEHLRDLMPHLTEERLRARLGRFGLIQQKAETPAGRLSGGERTRLSLALMCVRDPQILILDEPSNHLDIDSRQALIEAINTFPGAVVLISHDRRLVELTADTLWLVRDGRVREFDGDLDDYRRDLLESRSDRPAKPQPASAVDGKKPSAADRRSRLAPLRARARDAEREVERLQARKLVLDARLADPATYADGTDVAALNRDAAALEDAIASAEGRWLEAEAEIEALDLG